MIERLITWCARNRVLTIALVLVAIVAGLRAIRQTPLDAIPDLSDTQVIISTEWPGRSPDLIEDQVTYPIVTALLSAPHVRYVRGQSMMGDSFVYVVFEDGTDLYWARSRVLEYLSSIRGRLPEGVEPQLGPDATSVGWVFEYALVDTTGKNDLASLRSFQDWTLRYWLQSVEGVAEVASVGASCASTKWISIPCAWPTTASRSRRWPTPSRARTTTWAEAWSRSPSTSTSCAAAATSDRSTT